MGIYGVGGTIRQWREKKGRSQRQVAEKFRCSQQYVALVEAGYRPMPEDWLPLMANDLRAQVEPHAKAHLEKVLEVLP